MFDSGIQITQHFFHAKSVQYLIHNQKKNNIWNRELGKNLYWKVLKTDDNDNFIYTVKLVRAKLSENADTFIYGPYVRGPQKQFACVTCSFPAKTGKFLQVPHAEFTQVNLHQIKGISPVNSSSGHSTCVQLG